ncbi:MAG: transketolase C-terminal domain-containing protein [Vampirovibrionales bacterium]|nr:transketolase C-terminal domain-containing protein [Vampirovibrionales bacterium]
MRNAFVKTLLTLAQHHPNLWLMTGDLGFGVLEPFAERYPDRYINAGVAEQNMLGVAAGLALANPQNQIFTYSIGNFGTLRCLEQIRNDVCYHNLNIKIVAVGGGLAYGSHGYTHHAVEELAILRTLPSMTVMAPGDPLETDWAVRQLALISGPAYLRLGKAGEPQIHAQPIDPTHPLSEPFVLPSSHQGRLDVMLLSTGGMLEVAVSAADRLALQGVFAQVVSVPLLKPFPAQAIRSLISNTKTQVIVTLEEHVPEGGLHSVVCQTLASSPNHPPVVAAALMPEVVGKIGSQAYLRSLSGLSPEAVAASVFQQLAMCVKG